MKYVAIALAAAGAAQAQSGTARFGLKGGKFDMHGYAANGLDVFGFDKTGKDAWGRPISDNTAGLVAPVGKAIEPKEPEKKPEAPKEKHNKPKPPKPIKPTPTPFHTPTYTTIGTQVYPLVESTVVFPMSTLTKTVIETHSINIHPTPPVIRPVESTRVSCYGGQVTIKLKFPCPKEENNFMAEMLMAEVAYVSQTSRKDWDILVNDGSSVSVITCSRWAYEQLENTALVHPDVLAAAMYTPTAMTFCNPDDVVQCTTLPLECASGNAPVGGACAKKRVARRDADCGAGQFYDNGYCSKCVYIPGCSDVACSADGKSTCTQCDAGLSVSALGGCN